ncbi:hypothetical protein G6F68_018433 [Rhizopus microsporus]|nr:hypothetical protein G6F68_018433 [Rhizopus microsporus]
MPNAWTKAGTAASAPTINGAGAEPAQDTVAWAAPRSTNRFNTRTGPSSRRDCSARSPANAVGTPGSRSSPPPSPCSATPWPDSTTDTRS